jgi:hypothetical protein
VILELSNHEAGCAGSLDLLPKGIVASDREDSISNIEPIFASALNRWNTELWKERVVQNLDA